MSSTTITRDTSAQQKAPTMPTFSPTPHPEHATAMHALEAFGDTLSNIFGVLRWHSAEPPPAGLLPAIEEARSIIARAAGPMLASRIGPQKAAQIETRIAEIAATRGISFADAEREILSYLGIGPDEGDEPS